MYVYVYVCECVCLSLSDIHTFTHTMRNGWADFGPECKSPWCDLSGRGVRTAKNKEQGCYSVTELQSDSRHMTAKILKPDSALVWRQQLATGKHQDKRHCRDFGLRSAQVKLKTGTTGQHQTWHLLSRLKCRLISIQPGFDTFVLMNSVSWLDFLKFPM